MIKIKFDVNLMKTISLFDNITHANAKDCIEQSGRLIFVVDQSEMAKAIGPKGKNVVQLERMLKKKIKVIGHSENLIDFVRNVVAPVKTANVEENEGIVTITPVDSLSRGFLIGRGAVNLRAFEDIVKRYFPIKEIKVV